MQRTRRKKIDEIKQATRYDHLKGLLEKYDDTASKPLEVSKSKSDKKRSAKSPAPTARSDSASQAATSTRPQQGGAGVNPEKVTAALLESGAAKKPAGSINGAEITQALNAKGIQTTLPPQRLDQFQRTWLDRLADKVLGAESTAGQGGMSAAEQRYALICHICFTHNGLCPKEEWEEVQYICPRCGTFNSRRPSTVPVSAPWTHVDRMRTASNASSRPISPPFKGDHRSSGGNTSEEQERRGEEEEEEEEQETMIDDMSFSSDKRSPLRKRGSRTFNKPWARDKELMEVD